MLGGVFTVAQATPVRARSQAATPIFPHSNIPRRINPFVQLHILVFILAFTGVLGRIISIEAPSLVFWRTGLAAIGMALWLAVVNRRLLRLPPRAVAAAIGVGIVMGAHWVCFFWSISLANISVALAGFASISLFTAITEPLIERRPVRPSQVVTGAIVIVGILLIAGLETRYRTGFAVALGGSVLAALFPVFNRQLVRHHASRSLFLYEMTGACLVSAAAIPFIAPGRFEVPTSADWLPILTLAILCTLVAQTWNIHLLRRITAFASNLAFNFEPVWGIILGALLFHEHHDLHPGFYLGTLIIIGANFLGPVLRRRS